MAEANSMASPSGRASRATPQAPAGLGQSATIPDAVPRDPDDAGAVEWIAAKLSERQFRTLDRLASLPDRQWSYASEVGAPSTLSSLWDFKRGERGCFAPLALVYPDFSPGDRCNLWQITKLGRRAHASAIEARSGETRTRLDPKDESAVGEAGTPKSRTEDLTNE